MTQEILNKTVNRCYFIFYSIPDWYKTQEICERLVSKDPFLIVYCPDKCITQKMCDEAVEDSLTALKIIPDWFVTTEKIKKHFIALNVAENMFHFNKDSVNMVFNCN